MLGILICSALNMLCVLQHLLPGQARSVVIYTPSRGDPGEQVLCCCTQVVTGDKRSGVVIYNISAATRVTNVELYIFTLA